MLARVLLLQEWQAEVAAMLARAEQLKVLLAHRQAHHLSLLAAVLQHLHQQEVQQYDMPHSRSSSPSKRPRTPAVSLLQHDAGAVLTEPQQLHQQQEVVAGGLAAAVRQQQQQQGQLVSAQAALHTDYHSVCWDEAAPDLEEDDEFFMPVGLYVPSKQMLGLRPAAVDGVGAVGRVCPNLLGLPFPYQQLRTLSVCWCVNACPTLYAVCCASHTSAYGQRNCLLCLLMLQVAPLSASAAGSPDGRASIHTATGPPTLPFHMAPAAQASRGTVSDGDSLARTPSSGCSSLLEYVQHSMSPTRTSVQDAAGPLGLNSAGGSPRGAAMQQSLHSIEQQLLSIAGSAEVAAVLASALGYEPLPCSRTSSYCGGVSSAGGASVFSMPGTSAAGAGSFTFIAGSGQSSPGHSRPASVLGRLSSSAAKALEGLAAERSSIGGLVPRQQQRRRWQRPQKASSTLSLQHAQLPPGCCKSIGAVCYLCPHLKRIVLVDVGLTDEDVGDLVDALKVNSSIQHLDLSHNRLEDIGARVLAILLRPSAGSSSRLRSLCLQHNQIGECLVLACGYCALQLGQPQQTVLRSQRCIHANSPSVYQCPLGTTALLHAAALSADDGKCAVFPCR